MNRIDQLLDIMRRLRDPVNGCPWDRAQRFETIVPYTIEEAYEVADAIERGELDDLKTELGDLLFQVVFYAHMAHEAGRFDFNDVVEAITDKLIRRHPHVFSEEHGTAADSQRLTWEDHKASEREQRAADDGQPGRVLDDVPAALPALSRALKLQKRAAHVGFDWDDMEAIINKHEEEIEELRAALSAGEEINPDEVDEELGDVLFTLVNIARHLGRDPEGALRRANRKFERRFHYIETTLSHTGRSPREATLTEMEELWHAAKQQESS